MTVKKFMETMRTETKAITFIINCMCEQESFMKEEITKMLNIWGLEEVNNYYMINTKEMVINIK